MIRHKGKTHHLEPDGKGGFWGVWRTDPLKMPLREEPPLEDWLELLDCVRRRIQRNLVPEVEEDLLKRVIRDHYPEAEL